MWAETAAGRPGGRPAVAGRPLALDLLSSVRLGALPQGGDSGLDPETRRSCCPSHTCHGSGSMTRTPGRAVAAAVPMPSGSGVTVLRLPLRVTGTQSLCYDCDDKARLARILVTDHCQPDLEAAAGRALQADLPVRRCDCQWPGSWRAPRPGPRNRDCIVLVRCRHSEGRRCRPAAV